jgi:hypothetical protein
MEQKIVLGWRNISENKEFHKSQGKSFFPLVINQLLSLSFAGHFELYLLLLILSEGKPQVFKGY